MTHGPCRDPYPLPHCGASGGGTIFKLSANGPEYAVLYSFTSGGTEGYYPGAALTQASDGALYGTAILGGTSGYGAVFRNGTNGGGYTLDARQPDVMNHWNAPDRVRTIPLSLAGNRIVLPALSAAAIECRVP